MTKSGNFAGISSLLAIVLFVLLQLSPSQAAMQIKEGSREVVGTIVKMDLPTSVLTIKTDGGEEEGFRIDAATNISLGGKPAKISDLQAGQGAKVRADGDKALDVEATAAEPS